MPHRLRVVIKQGDLINEKYEVIVNPTNLDFHLLGGTAKSIARAAGMTLQDESKHYMKRYGCLKTGNVVHTTAGNLRPRIKYVVDAVGPDAREIKDIQKCADLVKITVQNCLRYINNILELTTISIPAISPGMFGVPTNMVAQAM